MKVRRRRPAAGVVIALALMGGAAGASAGPATAPSAVDRGQARAATEPISGTIGPAASEPAALQPAATEPAAAQSAATEPSAAEPVAVPETSPPAQPLTAWDLYRAGGLFMYPLTACSIFALALILERLVALRRSNVMPRGFLPGLRAVTRDLRQNRDQAIAFCIAHDSTLSRMMAAGIRRLPRGSDAAEKAIESAGANEALKLRKNLRVLYALGSVATLLGLIGTISGMISAFQTFARSSPTPNVRELSQGIYEAMVNTFAGLAIAVVVTIAYYYFVNRIERLVTEMNDLLAGASGDFGLDQMPE